MLMVWLVVGTTVGLHAEEHGRSGLLWGVLVFVFGLIAVVIYLVVHLTDN